MMLKGLATGMLMGAAIVGGAWAQTTPAKKAYLLVQSEVTNTGQYAAYAKLTPAIIEKFGGKFMARGGRNVTLEGAKAPARVVVIEFPSFDAAQAFYNSPEYVAARKVRSGAATMQIVAVEGL
jgi:uncharacterized protein (DUF1330 family)